MTPRRFLGVLLCLALGSVAGCGGSRAAPLEDGGLRPCTTDDQCHAYEVCSLGYCTAAGQRDAGADRSPGALAVTPGDTVDFGSPVLGAEVARQVGLANVGGETLTVSQITLLENDAVKEFSVAAPTTPFDLAPGASQTVTITLNSLDGQLDQGQLVITSTDPAQPTTILQLTTTQKGAVDLAVCVEQSGPTDCAAPPAFALGQLTYAVPVTRVFHVRATGQGTPVINLHSILFLSSGGMTAPHYQLQLFYRHPNPADPTQVIEDPTPLTQSDFPKLLSAGDEATAPAEIRGVLVFDALLPGSVPSESVVVQTDAGNVTAPITGQVTGCPPGFVDLDQEAANGCEYACTYQGPADDPDLGDPPFVDANCDGVDGEIDKAVFVAPPPKGNDTTGVGSMDKPYATIGKGLQVAAALSRRYVLVGAGTYAENITLADGVGLFGGYDASKPFWERKSGFESALIGQARGNADEVTVKAANLTKATVVGRLTIWSAPAAPGFSSYGVLAAEVPAGLLTLAGCEIHAGNGGAGSDGSSGTTGATGGDGGPGTQGREYGCASWASRECRVACLPGLGCDTEPSTGAWKPAGGTAGSSSCARTGGAGGKGGESGLNGGSGVAGTGGGVAGGGGAPTVNGTAGDGGGTAPAGVNGNRGTGGAAFGTAAAGGYLAAPGTAGLLGTHGAGGGGGGGGGGDLPYCNSTNDCACCASYGGSGGGGGGGGCRGTPGQPGTGGGGSFGVYLYNASPAIQQCVILVGAGGSGGRGGEGGAGGDGGLGASGGGGDPTDVTGAGAKGGNGGHGGRGGHGGGGGGGPAVGVLKAGSSSPTIDAATQQRISVPPYGASGGTSPDTAANGQPGVTAKEYTP